MRLINMDHMRVVYRGEVWKSLHDPSSKDMSSILEDNEAIVTWLQPVGGNSSIEEQIPCIKLGDSRFCQLSLRMMKAVWRFVCAYCLPNGLLQHNAIHTCPSGLTERHCYCPSHSSLLAGG